MYPVHKGSSLGYSRVVWKNTCIICGGYGMTLPTECPNRDLTIAESDAIREGKLDYYNGRWYGTTEEQVIKDKI